MFQNNESYSFNMRRRLDYDDGSYENVALFMSLMIEVMRFMIVSALCAPDGEECAEETPVRDWVHIMLWEQRRGGQYNNRAGTGMYFFFRQCYIVIIIIINNNNRSKSDETRAGRTSRQRQRLGHSVVTNQACTENQIGR
jgi:hypothetical protein